MRTEHWATQRHRLEINHGKHTTQCAEECDEFRDSTKVSLAGQWERISGCPLEKWLETSCQVLPNRLKRVCNCGLIWEMGLFKCNLLRGHKMRSSWINADLKAKASYSEKRAQERVMRTDGSYAARVWQSLAPPKSAVRRSAALDVFTADSVTPHWGRMQIYSFQPPNFWWLVIKKKKTHTQLPVVPSVFFSHSLSLLEQPGNSGW